jgi:hypothetical protein
MKLFKEQKSWPAACLLFLAVLAAYINTINGQFVFDDHLHIVENEIIKSSHIFEVFYKPLPPGNLYRPILILSYGLNYLISGLAPQGFHIFNILLHFLNVILIFSLFRMLAAYDVAIFAALIFAVHPAPSEAVANISGRSELLVHFFGLLFLLLSVSYLKTEYLISKGIHFLLVGLAFLFCIFSKENALVYLILLPLIVLFLPSRKLERNSLFSLAYLLLGILILYVICRLNAMSSSGTAGYIDFIDNPLIALSVGDRIINALYLLTRYLILIISPVRLSADYSFAQFVPLGQSFSIEQIILITLPFLMLIVAAKRFPRRDLYAYFILWFFASFAVTSNIFFPIGTVFANRLTYLAAPAVIGALVILFQGRLRAGFVICYFLFCASITIVHNKVWSDNLSLWTEQMKVAPLSFKTWGNYGAALIDTGRYAEAESALLRAVNIYPEGYGAYRVLGDLYSKTGDREKAQFYFAMALKFNPDDPITKSHYEAFIKTASRN